ncbi:MAG: dimethylsulfonioproprionate lyase family protein [Roseobacter sp.]|jgi:hypothetical protein
MLRLAGLTTGHLEQATAMGDDVAVRDGFICDLTALPANLAPSAAPCPPVRGLRYAAQAMGSDPAPVAMAARSAFGHMRWTEFYAEDDWSRSFVADFANGEGIGPDGRLMCDTIILGLFIMGPQTTYPLHAHPAQEFYLVLSGQPAFQVGIGSAYRKVDDLGVVGIPPTCLIQSAPDRRQPLRSSGGAVTSPPAVGIATT